MQRLGNHLVCVDVLSVSGLCVVGSSGSVILMGYGVGCGVTVQISGWVYIKEREGKTGM